MVLKEIRTTFRERAQLRGLLVSVVVLIVALGGGMSQLFRQAHIRFVTPALPAPAFDTTHPAGILSAPAAISPQIETSFGHSEDQARMVHWAAIGGATVISFFFSMGYLVSAVLAAFVGEKEARTLEILLASPMSDRKLFLIKCISVFLPSAVIGYLFAASVLLLAMAFVPAEIIYLPPMLPFYALVLGLPVMVMPQIFFVGVGAAISAKAETLKGASQAFSGVLMLFVFGGMYGVPLVLYFAPSIRPPLLALGAALALLAFPGSICIRPSGGWAFRPG